MSRRHLAILAAVPVLALGLLGMAPDEPDLDRVMKGLKDNLQAVAKSVSDPANDAATLKALADMQVLTLSGKLAQPPRHDVPDAKWDAHVAAYRADMARLLKHLAEMEIDVLEGRHDEAAAAVRDVLLEQRNASHDKFKQ